MKQHPWDCRVDPLEEKEEEEKEAKRVTAFFSPQSPGQKTFANLIGRSIIYGRNWPEANDRSQVGAGKEVWRLIMFNVITLDLQQRMQQSNLAFSVFSPPCLSL